MKFIVNNTFFKKNREITAVKSQLSPLSVDQAENRTLTKPHEKFFKSFLLLSLLLCLETNSCPLELKFCWSVSQSASETSCDISECPVCVFLLLCVTERLLVLSVQNFVVCPEHPFLYYQSSFNGGSK